MAEAAWFGGRLRELREAAGMTQEVLAEKAGLTRVGIAQLEAGRNGPTWETVLVLANALGTDCKAFTEPPAKSKKRGPGRPSKKN